MEKKKSLGCLLKLIGGFLILCVILLSVAAYLLNSKSFQNRVMHFATDRLSTMLATRVSVDSVSIDVWGQSISLYGLDIEDQQERKMLQMEKLEAGINLKALWNNEVKISEAGITGLHAQLYKPNADTPANFQFIIDSLKSQHPKKQPSESSTEKKERKKLVFDIKKISLKDVGADFYQDKIDHHAQLQALLYTHSGKQHQLVIDSLRYANDNHKPRKNVGKPHRGDFDAGHIDAVASLQLDISYLSSDSIVASLTRCTANERGSGIPISSLTLQLTANKQAVHLSDIKIKFRESNIEMDKADMLLPDSTRRLSYTTSTIKGRTILRDISRPFTPTLKKFTTPLTFSTLMMGDDNSMSFKDIHVATTDKKLQISASGRITNLREKHKLNVTFYVNKMHERGNIKQKIIDHFPIKKYMMKQMANLGDISYTGQFSVLWKKEQFKGLLHTQLGDLDFAFSLDELNKYLTGHAKTNSFHLGKAIDMSDIGTIACQTNFRFDISKPRTALVRKQRGGKLPIGHIDAEVYEASFKKLKVRNLFADINSNGAEAEGKIRIKGKHVDVLCSFVFTNTDSLHKMRIKPGLKLHKLSDDDKQAKEERKQQKKELKALKKEARALQKQQKAEERALNKQQKAEEKAKRKQQKAEEKAERKKKKNAQND